MVVDVCWFVVCFMVASLQNHNKDIHVPVLHDNLTPRRECISLLYHVYIMCMSCVHLVYFMCIPRVYLVYIMCMSRVYLVYVWHGLTVEWVSVVFQELLITLRV
jgi:hypothetical protein